MKNLKEILVAVSIFAFAIGGLYALDYMDRSLADSVKSGEKSLSCFIGDEQKEIEKEKVKYFKNGVWYFVNGQASNCEVK